MTTIGTNAFSKCSSLVSVTLPASVTNLAPNAFYSCYWLANFTADAALTSIGDQAFIYCYDLTNIFFKGNAPVLGGAAVFQSDLWATVYYLPGTTNWGATLGTRPTVLWNPQAQTGGTDFGVRTNRFGFNITAVTGTNALPFVVEACTNLANPTWLPLRTNTGSLYFSDPQWTNYPGRFYRLRSP